jgi:hypothetical protein
LVLFIAFFLFTLVVHQCFFIMHYWCSLVLLRLVLPFAFFYVCVEEDNFFRLQGILYSLGVFLFSFSNYFFISIVLIVFSNCFSIFLSILISHVLGKIIIHVNHLTYYVLCVMCRIKIPLAQKISHIKTFFWHNIYFQNPIY